MKTDPTPQGHGGTPLCGARLRQSDGHCRKSAGWGTTHAGTGRCRLHGGSTPMQVLAAERQQVETRARRLLADLGDAEPITDPVGALMTLAGEVIALKDAAQDMVAELDDLRYESKSGGEQLRAEVALYERSLDRAGKVLGGMVTAGIEARRVHLAQQQGALVVEALEGAMADAGLAPAEVALLRRALGGRLRAAGAAQQLREVES